MTRFFPTLPTFARPVIVTILITIAATPALTSFAIAAPQSQKKASAGSSNSASDESLFDSLVWREVGPYRGGRSAAVAGIPAQPNVYYFGATGGGVWKTTDGGGSWKNVSDGFFGGSIGAVAVSEWDPNVVYVGGGEKTVRGNVSHGDGIWKSTDAGKSWSFSGLADSRHISRIRIHPRNPDVVYAAVLGHLFGPNQMRGVYRSLDGGKSWERALFANENAGAVDLILDPTNPRVLFATTWRVKRTPYSLESGGEGSALWKSIDGGVNWKEITRSKGLPKGVIGIAGITVSPGNSQNVYAIIEASDGGVFRSRDGGESWERTSDSRDLRQRAWYYTRIYADPKDEDTVFVLNVRFHKSKDGGKTFTTIPTPHSDNHDLWISPDNPSIMIESNDGGANVSFDGGASWSRQDNQPTAQFYRVSTDNAFPYRLLGGQQDNSAVRIRNRSSSPGISQRDWDATAGGESGHIVAHPENPELVYGGSYGGFLTRYNHTTGELRDVNAWPDTPMGWGAAQLAYRFQWNFPIFFSQLKRDTLYAGANVLFRSTDGGSSWQPISPDLTRNDKTKMDASGGPITKDNTSVEYYGTIFATAESPLDAGILWAGSDDGLVHLSRDGGGSWTNVTPRELPEWAQINSIEADPFEKGGLYVAATRYKSDDFRPFLYRTSDYGKSWKLITRGIAMDHFTRVIRADPKAKGLLYAGTERGVYISFDDGSHWRSLQLKLPIVPITDLAVKEDQLIAATQGRGFWILENRALLPQLKDGSEALQLFAPSPAHRLQIASSSEPPKGEGTNPPDGVVFHFRIPDVKTGTAASLAILAKDGKLIREYSGKIEEAAAGNEATKTKQGERDAVKPAKSRSEAGTPETIERAKLSEGAAAADKASILGGKEILAEAGDPAADGEKTDAEPKEKTKEEKRKEEETKLPVKRGMNRFVWKLRVPPAERFEGMVLWGGGTEGPRALPGSYSARLTVGGESRTVPFEIKADPRSSSTAADLQRQFDLLMDVRDKLSEIHGEIVRIREVKEQLARFQKEWEGDSSRSDLSAQAKALTKKLTTIEEALYQTRNRSPQDPLNFPIRLNDKLASLAESVAVGDYAPTAQAIVVKQQLDLAIDAELTRLGEIWKSDVPSFNRAVAERQVPAVRLPAVKGGGK